MFRFETELCEPVREWVSSKGLDAMTEVKTNGKVPDVIGRSGDKIVVAIELKLSDWRRALYQAIIYTSFAHESYVAMPASKLHLLRTRTDMFRRWGVGVLVVHKDGKVDVVLMPSSEFAPYRDE